MRDRAPEPEVRAASLGERLWVRLLSALWVIGITAYYLRVQLAQLLHTAH